LPKKEDKFRAECIDFYSEIDLSQLLRKIGERVRHYLECEEASIFLYNPLREELYFESATGKSAEQLKRIVMRKGEGVAGWIAESGESLVVNDCLHDARFAKRIDAQTQFQTRSILGVPVKMGDNLLGIVEAINKIKGTFGNDDRRLLEYMAQFIAIPLQNALLFRKVSDESREKAQLLELSKRISASFGADEVYASLKEIICGLIDPRSLRVGVSAEGKVVDLLRGTVETGEIAGGDTTLFGAELAVFPLRSGPHTHGFLEIRAAERIPEGVRSLLRGLATFLAITLDKYEMHQQLLEKERLDRELQIAREIQQSFLVHDEVRFPGLDVAYLFQPSSSVGGDYYEIQALEPSAGGKSRLAVSINDISGHGLAAALLMSIFRANFVFGLRQGTDLACLIGQLNELFASTTDANVYVTSFTAIFEAESWRLSYVNAGHHAPVLWRTAADIEPGEGSLALGLFPGVTFHSAEIGLQPADCLLFFTDGLIEAADAQGREFSRAGLCRFLAAHSDLPAAAIRDQLIAALRLHCGRDSFVDDVSFIVVKMNGAEVR